MDISHTPEENSSFCFVVCMRNHLDDAVDDYGVLEEALRMTVKSLLGQTFTGSHVIVVCQKIPSWQSSFSDQLHFIDVSNCSVFSPNPDKVFDKLFRWIVGSIYSLEKLNPRYVMLMDADDYANKALAAEVMELDLPSGKDFFMINKGLNVTLKPDSEGGINIGRAYKVDEFDRTCGSCRIFSSDALTAALEKVNPKIIEKFKSAFYNQSRNIMNLTSEPIAWLDSVTQGEQRNNGSLLDTLARHVNQERHFQYEYLDLVGAAKGCGHGNHLGKRHGAIHWHRVISRIPTQDFITNFSLDGEKQCKRSLELLAFDIQYFLSRITNPARRILKRIINFRRT